MHSTSSKHRTPRAAKTAAALLAGTLALALTGCGGSDEKDDGGSNGATQSGRSLQLPKLDGQKLEVAAVWTGPEQDNFKKVLDEFEKRTGAKVDFVPTGDNTVHLPRHEDRRAAQPPDVAFLPQVGVLHQFAREGLAQAARRREAQAQLTKNFSQGLAGPRRLQGQAVRRLRKAANKSLIWYNAAAFENAGAHGAEDLGGLPEDRADPLRVGHAAGLGRRRGRLDADRLVRERLPLAGGPGEVRPAGPAQDQVDRSVRQAGADHARPSCSARRT